MTSPLTFPPSLAIADLQKTHEEYNPKHPTVGCGVLQVYQDLYDAGINFERSKNHYLRTRQIEKTKNGASYRETRLKAAHYTPHASGIMDSCIGLALKEPPCICVEKHDDPRAEYWRGLNDNADGNQRDLFVIARALLLQLGLHRRGYLTIQFPPQKPLNGTRLSDAKDAGNLDARISYLEAKDVDDWEYDADGNLLWARTYRKELVRENPYSPKNMERHVWAYITADAVHEYSVEWKVDAKEDEKPKFATLKSTEHGFKALPIIEVEVDRGFHIWDRLASTILALFNREAALEFALDSGALNLPVYKGEQTDGVVVLSESGCLNVGPNGDFFWRSPDGTVYEALAKDCDRLHGNLYSSIHTLALLAASQQENARQSGTAKEKDNEPVKALLRLLTAPILDAMKIAVNRIAIYRDEADLKPKVEGMQNFDSQAIEMLLNKAKAFAEIPQMPAAIISESNKRVAMRMLPDLKPELLKEFDEQPEEDEDEEEIQSKPSNSAIRNSKTGEPNGYGSGQASMKFSQLS